MGLSEKPMDPSISENQMEDSGPAGESALQGSVSFGRFANDSLSWEKCSSFHTDKSLEEVGKCSAASSVAQKKGYFEAHYKNMAVRKAEEEDKDKKRGVKARDPMDLEDQTRRDSANDFNAAETELDVDKSNGQTCDNAIGLESEVQNSKFETGRSQVDVSKGLFEGIIESKDPLPLIEDVKKSCCTPETPELPKSEEPLMGKEEPPLLCSEDVEESPKHIDDAQASDENEAMGIAKSESSLKSLKANSGKKAITTSGVKKTPTSTTPKSSVMPASTVSRSTLSQSIIPASKALSKKANGTSPLRNKKPTGVESRRVAPTSLHRSLNLDPANSAPPMSTTMRKSLIMESMGEKDIVKRAFKAFRNNSSPLSSPSPVKPSVTNEILGVETDAKASLVGTSLKKTEGGNRLVKKSSPLGGQTGFGKTSNPTRVSNTVGSDQRNNKSVSSTYGPGSPIKADQGNKVSKKLEDKVNGKPAESARLHSKEKKEAEIKRKQYSHDTKTKPIPRTFASRVVT